MFKKLMGCTFLFVLIDQIFKLAVSFFMNVNDSIPVISGFFNITYVKNIGAAFSILEGNRWLFVIISLLALNLIYIFFIKNKELKTYEMVLYALLIGGIIGNMIDRVVYGYVIDFLDFTFFGWNFAIFNIADSFIVVSIILLLIISCKGEISCKKKS